MGLLTKAGSVRIIFTPGSGLLRKVAAFFQLDSDKDQETGIVDGATTPAGGLLNRSLLLLHVGKGKTDKISGEFVIFDFSEKANQLIHSLDNLSRDFSFPYTVYSLLQKELDIRQGILFLYNHIDNKFQPWIYTGVPSRIVEGMQFLLDDFRGFWDGGNSPFMVNMNEVFPAVDSVLLYFPDRNICIPFNSENGFSGAIIASGPLLHEKNLVSFREFCNKTLWELGHSLYQAREIPLASLSIPDQVFASAEEAIARLQAGIGDSGAELNFITFSVDYLITSVATRFRSVSKNRLREDILFLLNSLLVFTGVAFPLRDAEVLVIVNIAGMYRPELFQFHVNKTLKKYFQGLFDSIEKELEFKVSVYPSGEKSLQQVLSEL